MSVVDDDDERRATGAADDEEHLSAAARWVGSEHAMVWLRRGIMGVALAFFVGALGYFVGVRTTEAPSNAVDVGFLRDMTAHHDQAVRMAQAELANGSDPVAKDFALEVIMFQRQELGRMQNFDAEIGAVAPEYDPRRTSMEWMGMPTPLERMPGMATEAQLEALEAARGIEADKLFLALMRDHHLGGAHMSEYEAAHGANPKIREMAEGMARNQRVEVNEYQSVLNRLNAPR